MSKQGLLFADAPEPSYDLYCNSLYQVNEKLFAQHSILFNSIEKLVEHKREFHKEVFGIMNEWHDGAWYPIEYHLDIKEVPFQLTRRPIKRFNVTQQMLDFLQLKKPNRTCWCGKPKTEWENKYQRLYCSPEHSEEWTYERTTFWNWYRDRILGQHRNKISELNFTQTCDSCGITTKSCYNEYNVDHIIAIVNGGHPWHRDNLQVLCEACHKAKTKLDMEQHRENTPMVIEV